MRFYLLCMLLFFHTATGEQWSYYNRQNSPLPGDHVYSIAIDLHGRKWFATNQGVAFMADSGWQVFTEQNSNLPSNVVWTIETGNDTTIWAGTDNAGVACYNGKNWFVWNTDNSLLPNNGIYDIDIDSQGNKWFATWGGGVVKFDDEVMTVWNSANSILDHDKVTSLLIEKDHIIWVGTATGLYRFDGKSDWNLIRSFGLQKQNPLKGPRNDAVYELSLDDRILWIGLKYGGLWRYDRSNWTAFNAANSPLPNDRVYAIAVDKKVKWFGTLNGLVAFDGVNWKLYAPRTSPLPDEKIYSIAIDSHGNKWIGTMTAGVAVMPVSSLSLCDSGQASKPDAFRVYPGFPNPFNSEMRIRYDMPYASHLNVDVFDVSGRHVKTLFNALQLRGTHHLQFNAGKWTTGVYWVRFRSDRHSKTVKCLYIK